MKYLLLILIAIVAFSQERVYNYPIQSLRNANYEIEVKLFPSTKILRGSELIYWKNITSKATNELWFHLYLNAFSNDKSTFITESGGELRGVHLSNKDRGHQKIEQIFINNKNMTGKLEFRQTDDRNQFDSTVVMLKLDDFIERNDSVEIRIVFFAKLPRIAVRMGFIDNEETKNFFLIGQWYPKIAVLEEKGWNCHQYHGKTEFYSDFGNYDVKMLVPKEFKVGASGELVGKKDKDNAYQEHHYFISDVHDFAWTAYPDFQEALDEYKGVKLRLLYNTEQSEKHVKEQFESVKNAFDFYGKNFGKYPYSTLTMVNPPKGASGSEGMEYPTFITCGYNKGIPDAVLFRSEYVSIHEFGHQIFQGIIASNEFEHAWMDEGLNTYGDSGTIDRYYKGLIAFSFFRLSAFDFHRSIYLFNPNAESIMMLSYLQLGTYYTVNSYSRPAILLKSLENYIGKKEFFRAMRHYYEKWKFRHPYPKDFFEAINERTDEDLSWFFQQFFYENKVIDYDIVAISSRKIEVDPFTLLEHSQLVSNTTLDNALKPIYLNTVTIQNHGEGYFPMDFIVKLENGNSVSNLKWDHKKIKNVIYFYSNSALKSATLDPERKVLFDLNYYNNGKEFDSPKIASKFTNRLIFWIENVFQLFVGL